jgi:hypothetical protein
VPKAVAVVVGVSLFLPCGGSLLVAFVVMKISVAIYAVKFS